MKPKSKPKNYKNAKSKHPSNEKSLAHNHKSSKNDYKRFIELNSFFDKVDQLNPGAYYTYHIISRTWLRNWKKSSKEKLTEPLGPANAEFIHPNPYKLFEKIFVNNEKYVLVNNLDLNYEFELATEEAWNWLASKHEVRAIPKVFYLNEEYTFVETIRLLSLNVILVDENNQPHTYLLQLEETRNTGKLIEQLCYHLKLELDQIDLYLMDTRLDLEEILKGITLDSIIYGKLLPENATFSFKHLKTFEIICIVLNKSKHILSLSPKTDGFCYSCRKLKPLQFKCGCVIASYCSIDCKYSDYLSHKYICPEIVDTFEDINSDLKELEGKSYNNGEKGLTNVGNSCYLNCLLQILKTVPAVKENFISSQLDIFKNSNFLMSLYHIMKKINLFERDELKPWPLKIALGLQSSNYLFFAQNDSSECLDSILNLLDESGNEKAIQISNSFKGSFVTKFKCLGCKHVKTQKKEEPFFIMALSLVQEKQKFDCEFYEISAKDRPFELKSKKVILKEAELIFEDIAKQLNDSFDPNKTLLFMIDKEKVKYVSDAKEPIQSIISKQKHDFKFQDSILLFYEPTLITDFYLFASFNFIQLYNKHLEMKTKLCNARPIQISEKLIDKNVIGISGEAIHLSLFNYLRIYIIQFQPELAELFEKYDLRNDFSKLKIVYFHFFNYAIEKEEEISNDKIEEENRNDEKRKCDEDEITYTNHICKTVIPLKSAFYIIKYVNRDPVCSNCGKKGEHACLIIPNEKLFKFSEGKVFSLDIFIEFPANSSFSTFLKKITEPERQPNIPPKKDLGFSSTYTVESSLETYFEAQRIDRNCKHCGSKNSTMATSIKKFPSFLVLHLKRFTQKFHKNNYVQVKIEDFVDFEFEIKLEGNTYHLMGIINHRGDLDHGHYTSFVYHRETKNWMFFDDANCEIVQNPSRMKSKDNYILIYELIQDN